MATTANWLPISPSPSLDEDNNLFAWCQVAPDAGPAPNKPELSHHSGDPWFDDGNLILEAGKTRFRISKGVLAARSPVFKEMLLFPQPLDEELVDGCPLVHMHDAPEDVGYFLRAIYDSR